MAKLGLLLTGGGARAAYQVGVLRAISDIGHFKENPFNVISGVSAGAMNATWIAAMHSDFNHSTKSLWNSWASLEMEEVFKTNPGSFLKNLIHWIGDITLPPKQHKSPEFTSLLDSSPLINYINSKLDFDLIKKHISEKKLHGIAITTTNYNTGSSVTFFDGHPSIEPWQREWRTTRRTHITNSHILASTAIPIFFPPVRLDDGYYGDGGIKLSSPFSPLVHMGAEKILAIGIHHQNDKQSPSHPSYKFISMGDVAGTLLNTLFFHSIEADLERFKRINRTVSILTKDQLANEPDKLRYIPMLMIQPSKDLGQVGIKQFNRFPKTVRYLLKGIGASDLESKDLMSYLAFEKEYIQNLMELGYQDAMKKKDDVQLFFST